MKKILFILLLFLNGCSSLVNLVTRKDFEKYKRQVNDRFESLEYITLENTKVINKINLYEVDFER